MRNRPWPLVILAFCYFLSPLGNLLINSWLTHSTLLNYLSGMLESDNFLALFQFFVAYPLAGYAIYQCKRWSLPVYFLATALGIFFDFKSRTDFPQQFPLWLFYVSTITNVALVSYFLLPAVRAPFFNSKMRWWENKPRYRVNLWANLNLPSGTFKCFILDMSEGGVFIKSRAHLELGTEILISFAILRERFSFRGTVVHQRRSNHPGYGVRWTHNAESLTRARRLTAGLKAFGAHFRGESNRKDDFIRWLSSLSLTKAWLPSTIPTLPRPSASNVVPISATSSSQADQVASSETPNQKAA